MIFLIIDFIALRVRFRHRNQEIQEVTVIRKIHMILIILTIQIIQRIQMDQKMMELKCTVMNSVKHYLKSKLKISKMHFHMFLNQRNMTWKEVI